jgi:DNA-3-methyladenine glycosylase (3mg)
MNLDLNRKLPSDFYLDDVVTVAKALLGKIFVKKAGDNFLAGRIVELEAYNGSKDAASHSFNGITKRNEVMFNAGGCLYVYFTYGMHFCCNVVAGAKGLGVAVLLRGIEPINGIETMGINRFGKKNIDKKELMNLTNGPGKICSAYLIDKKDNGTDLTGNKIFILDAPKIKESEIIITGRIGIKKAVENPWRFYIESKYVSKR